MSTQHAEYKVNSLRARRPGTLFSVLLVNIVQGTSPADNLVQVVTDIPVFVVNEVHEMPGTCSPAIYDKEGSFDPTNL